MMGQTRYGVRKSLAGRCGIPAEADRIYVGVDTQAVNASPTTWDSRPVAVYWPDGRSWKIESIYRKREYGRAEFGNRCVRYDVCIRKQEKTIWCENGAWFVERRKDFAPRL